MKKRIIKKKINDNHFRTTMYSPRNKIYSIEWIFHQVDEDPKPSVPHGHSKDNKYRLSLWDGKVYKKQAGKLEYVGCAKKKELRLLYKNKNFQEFVAKSRDWYINTHPFCPELSPFFDKKILFKKDVTTIGKNTDVPDEIVIKLTVRMK